MKAKRILSVLLTAVLILCLLPATALAADTWDGTSVAADFAGGSGTSGNPYEIATGAQLAYLAQQVNSGASYSGIYFILTDDINLSSHAWTPIGNDESTRFSGSFDGGGHSVTGLNVNVSLNAGLFGNTVSGSSTIKNVSVSGAVTATTSSAGGVLGVNQTGCIIENCTFEGTVTARYSAGGITGYNGGTIQNCAFEGSAESTTQNAGGITGFNGGTIQNCRSTGNVTASTSYAGGVAGFNGIGGMIRNCYNTGSISGVVSGGVAGDNGDGTIQNCYNTGNVSGSIDTGGVVGANDIGGTIQNCYWHSGSAGNGIGSAHGTYSGIGSFADADSALTATDGTTLNYGSNLLSALNAWVDDQTTSSNYLGWTAMAAVTSGYPIFAVSVAPSAAIDYAAEKLTGLNAGAQYIISSAALTAGSGGTIDIADAWLGTTVGIVKHAGAGYSRMQNLAVPARPAAPSGVTAVQPAAPSGTGGIDGVSAEMEYSGGTTWTPCTGGSVSGLAPGTYSVRYIATSSAFASASAQVTIHAVYTLIYGLDGGAASPANPTGYTIEDLPLTLNNPTRTGYIFTGWSGTGLVDKAMTVTIPTGAIGDRQYTANWETVVISGLPQTYKMYTGGRVTWEPQPEGGTWDWDKGFFSATFNSPATFTALKSGTSVITYMVDGVSRSVTVTIKESELPQTGQSSVWIWALVSLAAVCGAGAMLIGRKKRVKAQNEKG